MNPLKNTIRERYSETLIDGGRSKNHSIVFRTEGMSTIQKGKPSKTWFSSLSRSEADRRADFPPHANLAENSEKYKTFHSIHKPRGLKKRQAKRKWMTQPETDSKRSNNYRFLSFSFASFKWASATSSGISHRIQLCSMCGQLPHVPGKRRSWRGMPSKPPQRERWNQMKICTLNLRSAITSNAALGCRIFAARFISARSAIIRQELRSYWSIFYPCNVPFYGAVSKQLAVTFDLSTQLYVRISQY